MKGVVAGIFKCSSSAEKKNIFERTKQAGKLNARQKKVMANFLAFSLLSNW